MPKKITEYDSELIIISAIFIILITGLLVISIIATLFFTKGTNNYQIMADVQKTNYMSTNGQIIAITDKISEEHYIHENNDENNFINENIHVVSNENDSFNIIDDEDANKYINGYIGLVETDTSKSLPPGSNSVMPLDLNSTLPQDSNSALPPLTLEQSISQAILKRDWGFSESANVELHKTLYVEAVDGMTKAYVLLDVSRVGWFFGYFTGFSRVGTLCILTFKKDSDGNYAAIDVLEADPKFNPENYVDFAAKTGYDNRYIRPEKPSNILLYTLIDENLHKIDAVNTRFGKYLPEGIFKQKYLPNFEQVFGSDGSICYYWSKSQNSQVVRKIELELCDEGIKRFYFKDYGIDDGYIYAKIQTSGNFDDWLPFVQDFAKDFWIDGSKMTFTRIDVGYETLYDPGIIENWTAEYKGNIYNVMVNLRMGYIIYADMQ